MSEAVIALVTAVISGAATFVIAREQFRVELQRAYDQRLRSERVKAYAVLWRLTGNFPKYAKTDLLDHQRLHDLSVELRDWYFKVGGMFLTDNSRDAYFAFQDQLGIAIARMASASTSDFATVLPDQYETVRQAGSRLRTNLCSDLRSRIQPALDLERTAESF